MGTYIVTAKTKDATWAGTYSDVAFSFRCGAKMLGNFGLAHPGRGDTNVFTIDTEDLAGPIDEIMLVIDGNNEWKPEWITIEDQASKLKWMGDFRDLPGLSGQDEGDGNAINDAVRPAILIAVDQPIPPIPNIQQKQNIAQQWFDGLSGSIGSMWAAAGGAEEVFATQFINLVEAKYGAKVHFLTSSLGAGASAVGMGFLEAGYVRPVRHGLPKFDEEAGRFLCITHGIETDFGFGGGLSVAAWMTDSLTSLTGWGFCRSVVLGIAPLSLALSVFWSRQELEHTDPVGVEVSALAGISLAPGSMVTGYPYTWIWT